MRRKHSLNSSALLYVMALSGCAHMIGNRAAVDADRAKRGREVKVLVAQPTPTDLATAALLSFTGDPDVAQPLKLIEQAETLAPRQPEFVWAQLAICRRYECDAKEQMESHLKALDPECGSRTWNAHKYWRPTPLSRMRSFVSALVRGLRSIGTSSR